MKDEPREVLADLIAEHGVSLCEDPRRVEGFLRDLCGKHRREINVLVAAGRERIPQRLSSMEGSTSPREVVLERFTKQLSGTRAIREAAARWAVETWALALGVVDVEGEGSSREEIPYAPLGSAVKRARTFKSRLKLTVMGRDASDPGAQWKVLGETPGSVGIPSMHELGIGRYGDIALQTFKNLIAEIRGMGVTRLGLDSMSLGEEFLKVVASLADLEILRLWRCNGVTQAGVNHLSSLGELRSLSLWRSKPIGSSGFLTSEGLTQIQKCDRKLRSRFKVRVIGQDKLTNDLGWSELGRTPGTATIPPHHNVGIKRRRKLSSGSLEELFTEFEFAEVAIDKLELRGWWDLDENSLRHMTSLSSLSELELPNHTKISDADINALASLNKLRKLDVSFSMIADIHLAHLTSLSALEKLSISGCERITDAGLAHLASLPKLMYVSLYGCERITPAGVRQLESRGIEVWK